MRRPWLGDMMSWGPLSQGPALTRPRRLPRPSQKTATAVAHCKRGNGLIKVNGRPLEMIEPRTLQYKVLGSGMGVRVARRKGRPRDDRELRWGKEDGLPRGRP